MFKAKSNSSISQDPLITGKMRAMVTTHAVKKFCAKRNPAAAGVLHNFTQDSSESSTKFFPYTLRNTH